MTLPPLDVLKVDHVAWAAWDAVRHVRLLTDLLGATFVDGGDEPHAGFRWLQFELPGGKVEVIEPLHRDGFLYRFLTKHGEGMHHMTLYVADLARSIELVRAHGYTPVDVDLHNEFWKEAFLSPRQTSGVLLQLAETLPAPNPVRRPLEEYLADRPGLGPPPDPRAARRLPSG